MASRDPNDPHRPSHPGDHPTSISKGRNNTTRWIGIVAGVVLLVGLLWWLMGGTTQTPGQEHTLGEPAGVGTTAAPEADTAVDPAADPDDPQAAIGADPHTEPTSPQAAEQADAPPPADDDVADDGETTTPAPAN